MRPFFMLVFFRNLPLFFHLLLHYIYRYSPALTPVDLPCTQAVFLL